MKQDSFSFHSSLHFNWIYVIQSLKKSDLKTGQNLAEDKFRELQLADKIDFQFTYYEIADRGDFFNRINIISNMCKAGIKPILHFDLHGLEDKSGIVLFPSKESISWKEFASVCKILNALCQNNLMIVMASCFGLHAITEVSIKEVTPYCYLIGAQEKVEAKKIDIGFKEFYSVLLKTCDVDTAMKKLDPRFRLYQSEQLFMVSFASYLRDGCIGKGRKKRVERLLTEYVEIMKKEKKKVRLNEARKVLKMNTKLNKGTFTRYANRFLLADHPTNIGRFNCTFFDSVYIANNLKVKQKRKKTL